MPIRNLKFLAAALLAFLMLSSTLVRAADDYQEVSYDDLVNQLSSKKKSVVRDASDPFDSIKIHTGFGLITSAANMSAGGSSSYRYMTGFQLSAGIDLFSPKWLAEGTLRNFGTSTSGSESRSMREYDLKALYKDTLTGRVGYRLGAGIGTRTLRLSDSSKNYSVNDTTPVSVFVGGIDIGVSQLFSFGIEAGLRTAMVTTTADKNSGDLTVHMDASF
jgi:hypothetical protein